MPSRKSDVRRSDVSAVSRPADDEDSPMLAADVPPHPDTATETPIPVLNRTLPGQLSAEAAEPNAGTAAATATVEKGKDKDSRDRERREDAAITIEDLNLPKSIITRLAKGVLPPNTQIQANAILALSKSATVFISHLSNAANEWTMSGGKKTIMPADVFRALDDIEYGFMREKLEAEFAKFNEVQSTKRSAYRKKVSAAKRAAKGLDDGSAVDSSVLSAGTAGGGGEAAADTAAGTSADGAGLRAAKKAKVGGDGAAGARGHMAVDGDGHGDGEVSDAETEPDEDEDEDENEGEGEEDDDEDEDEEDEEEGVDDDGDAGGPGESDELEERREREVEDEALDEDSE